MASPHQLPPQVGDSTNLLLKKLVTATQALSSGGGVFLTEAEADLLYFRLNGSNNPFTATSLTVATVRDGFSLTSEGSIDLAAGGANENITATPSGTGWLNVGSVSGGSGVVVPLLQVAREASGSPIFPSLELVGYQNGQTAQMFNVIAKAGGTAAAPTNASANATIGGYRFYAYANGAFRGVANISAATSPTFGSADFTSSLAMGPSSTIGVYNAIVMVGGSNTTGIGSGIVFGSSVTPYTQLDRSYFAFDTAGNFSRPTAWGTTGGMLAVVGRTITDTVSSGTVASAVGHSFGVPTFAASAATTFTTAANLYIAGDVANGTNVTLTNSYGLWNVGKTRLDGSLIITPQALSGAGAINLTTSSTHYTSTGGAQALTLANGTAGQRKNIIHVVDGGDGILTPTTALGYTTITFTNVGDSVDLEYTAAGWAVVGFRGAVIA